MLTQLREPAAFATTCFTFAQNPDVRPERCHGSCQGRTDTYSTL